MATLVPQQALNAAPPKRTSPADRAKVGDEICQGLIRPVRSRKQPCCDMEDEILWSKMDERQARLLLICFSLLKLAFHYFLVVSLNG